MSPVKSPELTPPRRAYMAHLAARARPGLLWMIVFVGVLNFLPAMFEERGTVTQDPAVWKLTKDIPLVLLLVGAALMPGRKWDRDRYVGARQPGQVRAVVALLLWAAYVVGDGIGRGVSASGFLVSFRYYVAYPLLVLAMVRLSPTIADIKAILQGIVVLGALQGLIAIPNVFGLVGARYPSQARVGDFIVHRAVGTLGNPDNLGLFLGLPASILLAAALAGTRESDRLVSRRALWVLLSAILLGIVLSFSKTAFVALGVTLGAQMLVIRGSSRGSRTLRKAALVFAAMALLALVASALRSGGQLSIPALLGTRTTTNPAAFQEWTQSPTTFVVGEGVGSQIVAHGASVVPLSRTDDMFLSLALEGGLVGLLLFGAVVAMTLAWLSRISLGNTLRRPEIAGLWGYIVFFLLYTPLALNFRLFPGSLLFWMAIGLAIVLVTKTLSAMPSESSANDPFQPNPKVL